MAFVGVKIEGWDGICGVVDRKGKEGDWFVRYERSSPSVKTPSRRNGDQSLERKKPFGKET